MSCPLCLHSHIQAYHQDRRRSYLQCQQCELVFVEPSTLPDAVAEKNEYDLHQNQAEDPGYQQFLSRLADPLNLHLEENSHGLDFGCGPTPLLANLLTKLGNHRMSVFDPFYANDKEVLLQTYDFISCSEAIEHFHRPQREWSSWMQMLKPKGWLGIMTKRVIDKQRFSSWHYKNDPTHVSFFSDNTFAFLASRDGLKLKIISNDVVLMQKLA